MCGSSAPQAADPTKTADTQTGYNQAAYNQTMAGNAMNQSTPFGTLTYTPTVDENGVTRYTATQTLDPKNQGLLDSLYGTKGLAGTAASNVLSGAYGGAPNVTGGADSLMNQRLGAQLDYMNPFFDRQTDRMDNQLRNQGLMPGSEAYKNSMNELRQSQGQTVSGATAQFMPEAFSEAMQSYKLPAEMATSLSNLSAPMGISLTNTPQGSMQAANFQAAQQAADQQSMEAWKAEQEKQSAMISGLMGGASSMLMMSDRRVKTDIERVGWLDNGLPIYRFRFVAGGPVQIGLMAQDIEQINPDAVTEIGGVKHVDYVKATAAQPTA